MQKHLRLFSLVNGQKFSGISNLLYASVSKNLHSNETTFNSYILIYLTMITLTLSPRFSNCLQTAIFPECLFNKIIITPFEEEVITEGLRPFFDWPALQE